MLPNLFPIDGLAICSLIDPFNPEQLWEIIDIETLTDTNTKILGELWKQLQIEHVKLTTRELCNALKLASQIISLDVHLVSNPSVEIFIEDGLLIKCSLEARKLQ
jgi:hypothetical protein